jgi:glycosyltransferase involved in cell wall biosynthesis
MQRSKLNGNGGAARLVVINDMSIARGGATKLALDLVRGVRKRGRKVTFFAGDDGANPEFGELGVEVEAIHGKRLLESRREGFVNGIFNARSRRALSTLIDRIDAPDVVYHVHSWSQTHSPSIFEALKPVAARTCITAHDFFLACPNGNYTIYPKSRQCGLTPMSSTCIATDCDKRHYSQKLWRVARQAALRAIIDYERDPFTVIAIQAGMLPFLVRGGVPETRIRILPNPSDRLGATRVAAEENREAIFVGRIEHEKGVDLLAAAAKKAGVALTIIGEGPAAQDAKAACPDARFTGWLEKADLIRAIARARLLVMPSRCTEPFGLVAGEALGVGVPVLASAFCLLGEDLKRLGMGDVVDVLDADAFASKLAELMRDDDRIERMSRAAFRNAEMIGPSTDLWIDSHIQLYDLIARAN